MGDRLFPHRLCNGYLARANDPPSSPQMPGHRGASSFCAPGRCPTKKIKGLHENDFIMAGKLDKLAHSRQTTRRLSRPVCIENLIRFDCAVESQPIDLVA